jgi:hypothetical protein
VGHIKRRGKECFFTTDKKQTLKGAIGSLFTSFLTLMPIEQHQSIRYEVKIVKTSGEEVQLLRRKNAELAEDMVKRVVDFSTKREVTENIGNAQSLYQTEKHEIYTGFWRRLIAFVINYIIVSAATSIIGLLLHAI